MGASSETQSSGPPAPPGPPPLSVAIKAIGVIALAQLGSSVSSQLVDLGIADLGGGLSLSADDASWIACVATMAEVVSIPIAATLARALSMRRLVLWATGLYVLCAAVSLLLVQEQELVPFRAVQSFCGGVLSVLLFVAIMAMLPAGPKRGIGLAFFAFASTAPSALSATVGAFVTERFGWPGFYYFDLAWSLALFLLAWRMLHPAPSAMRLSEIDWPGYVLLAIGLSALILFMKQGDRFFWLENPIIRQAGVVAAVLLPLSVLAFALRKRRLIDLSLLGTPTFGWAVTLATFYRFGLVMSAFIVPQALTRLQGFRLPEIGAATIWMLWAELLAFPLAWLWASRGDPRQPLSLGLLLFAVGAALASLMTPAWQGSDFRLSLIAIGLGQGLFLVPTVFYATRDVAPQQGTSAAALFNLSRVVGQTFGIAAIGSLITEREKFHSAVLVDSLARANAAVGARLNALTGAYFGSHGDPALAALQAWKSLSGLASKQAYVLAFADSFKIVAVVLAISALLVLMLPSYRPKTTRLAAKDVLPAGRPS